MPKRGEGRLAPDAGEGHVKNTKEREPSFAALEKVLMAALKTENRRLIREEEELISKGKIVSLKRFKDDVASVDSGLECGIAIEGVKKYFPGDRIVAYKINEIKRKLSDS